MPSARRQPYRRVADAGTGTRRPAAICRRVCVSGLLAVAFVFLGAGCSGSQGSEGSAGGVMADGGSWYARHAWPHDGNPIESDNFVVYSDSAGRAARETVAKVAEDVLTAAIEDLGSDSTTTFR